MLFESLKIYCLYSNLSLLIAIGFDLEPATKRLYSIVASSFLEFKDPCFFVCIYVDKEPLNIPLRYTAFSRPEQPFQSDANVKGYSN